MEIRNIAIIAHVDHGKTTLTDSMLHATSATEDSVSMDSGDLEQERGITIYSKNAGLIYKDTKINIVDTPGHADFGSEVERVLRSIDSVLLVVDAQEGPMPQTRFVLKKSLALGIRPLVIINKIDKPAADANRVHNEVFDLFAELGATNEQLDFPVLYAIGKDGIIKKDLDGEDGPIDLLLDMILEHAPAAPDNKDDVFRAQPFNLAYDNYLGRLAIIRVYGGTAKVGDVLYSRKASGDVQKFTVSKLFAFHGVSRVEQQEVEAGDIAVMAGLPDVFIGDTISDSPDVDPLEVISIDEPTIKLSFLVNDSPFAGKEGKFVTSRQIRERLEKELEVNVGLHVDLDDETTGSYAVYGRGELHIAILIENMRREGYELQVSEPHVIFKKDENGDLLEPFEEVVIDVPSDLQGVVIEKLSSRGAKLDNIEVRGERSVLSFTGPSRGMFGYRNVFVVDTKGQGILASRVIGYRPYAGEISRSKTGSMISQERGKALAYSLANLETRGSLYISANTEVYEGMVIGSTSKGLDMTVNPIKGKHLTNMRASGSDDSVRLTPPLKLTVETGLEIMDDDEYLEVTPQSVRLRKKHLTEVERTRVKRSGS